MLHSFPQINEKWHEDLERRNKRYTNWPSWKIRKDVMFRNMVQTNADPILRYTAMRRATMLPNAVRVSRPNPPCQNSNFCAGRSRRTFEEDALLVASEESTHKLHHNGTIAWSPSGVPRESNAFSRSSRLWKAVRHHARHVVITVLCIICACE